MRCAVSHESLRCWVRLRRFPSALIASFQLGLQRIVAVPSPRAVLSAHRQEEGSRQGLVGFGFRLRLPASAGAGKGLHTPQGLGSGLWPGMAVLGWHWLALAGLGWPGLDCGVLGWPGLAWPGLGCVAGCSGDTGLAAHISDDAFLKWLGHLD